MNILRQLFFTKCSTKNVKIRLMRKKRNPIYSGRVSLGRSYIDFIVREESRIIEMGDISCDYNNHIVSLLMRKLINYANQNDKIIVGWISYTNKEHLEQLTHFYEDLGFELAINSENFKEAEIVKRADKIS